MPALISPPRRGFFSPPIISAANGGWGPKEGLGFSKREIIIGPFTVTKQEHSACLSNKLMDEFKINLGANWENIKKLNLGAN